MTVPFNQAEEARRTGFATTIPTTTLYQPWTQQQLYVFVGSLSNIAQVATFQFFVLAGDGAPNVTAGWAKINIIDRPQRVGFTVPAGYDPITVDIPIQFESWVRQPPFESAVPFFLATDLNINTAAQFAGLQVEDDIQKLEWMAGRGKLFGFGNVFSKGVGASATGDPPLVTVRSLDANGNETNLIPKNLHGATWLISSISYGVPLRDRDGNRRRQPATVTLTEFVAAAGSGLDSPTTRARARTTQAGKYLAVQGAGAYNTIAKLVETYCFNPTFQTKVAVLNFNRDRLKIRSVNQALPAGVNVYIPASLLIAAP